MADNRWDFDDELGGTFAQDVPDLEKRARVADSEEEPSPEEYTGQV